MDATASTEAVSSGAFATRAGRVFLIVGIVLAVLFAMPHLALGAMAVTFSGMYADMGGELGGASALVLGMAAARWFTVALIALDAAIFYVMYRLARRYGAALMLATPLIYLGITSVLGWLIYMPMFQVVTLVD